MAIQDVLTALSAVELDPGLVAVLDEPLSFAGGRRMADMVVEHVFPLLSDDEQRQALGVLARFADLPSVPSRFVHGDLAPVNLRWENGKLTGILDWDFAHAADSALDAAAFGAFGWPLVRRVVGAAVYERARTHAALFPLSGAAGALLQGEYPDKYLVWFRRRCAVREHPPG